MKHVTSSQEKSTTLLSHAFRLEGPDASQTRTAVGGVALNASGENENFPARLLESKHRDTQNEAGCLNTSQICLDA